MNEILTSKQAAELLQISVQSIRGMASVGEVPAAKISDDWRFLRSHLLEYMSDKALSEQRRRKEESGNKKPQDAPALKAGRPKKMVDLSAYPQ